MSEINVPLLEQVLDQIEKNPKTWDQGNWRCKTGMCFAGWTVELAGGEWAFPDDHGDAEMVVATEDEVAEGDYFVIDSKLVVESRIRAQSLLGLHWEHAEKLFRGSNTLPTIRRIVADLKADSATRGGEGA